MVWAKGFENLNGSSNSEFFSLSLPPPTPRVTQLGSQPLVGVPTPSGYPTGSNTPCGDPGNLSGVPLRNWCRGPNAQCPMPKTHRLPTAQHDNAQNDPRTHSGFAFALFRRMQYSHPSLLYPSLVFIRCSMVFIRHQKGVHKALLGCLFCKFLSNH